MPPKDKDKEKSVDKSTASKKKDKDKDKESSQDKKKKDKDESKEKKKKDEKSPKTPKSQKSEDDNKSKKSSKTGKRDSNVIPNNNDQQKQIIVDPQANLQNQQPLLVNTLQRTVCVHHGIDLEFFCESCEEPICRQCTILGPHNSQLHRINKIDEAFRSRVAKLSENIKVNLLLKRDQLLAQIHRIEYRIEEIRYIKTIIERDARAEFQGIVERLRSAEGIKVAILQHEMSEIQKDLDKINDVGYQFNDLSKNPTDPVQFLLKSRNMYENIEFLVAKPFKTNIDVYPYDLPREQTEMRLQLQKVNAQKALIEFKNELIWKFIEEKKTYEDKIKQQLESAACEELQEWSRLTDKFTGELKKYQLVCFYCGVALDEKTINKKCKENVKQQEEGFQGYTEKIPESKYNGNQRHFFAQPRVQLVEMMHDMKIKEKSEDGKPQFILFMEHQIQKLNKIIQDKKINFLEILKQHDHQQNGQTNLIQFRYIMQEIIGLPPNDIDSLIKFLDPYQYNFISYTQLLKLLNDPSQLDKFPSKEEVTLQNNQKQ